jgi:acyl-CoA synthetase (AMP-forming)/AMP-acid ligase II
MTPLLVGEILRTAARRAPERPAVTCGGRALSFGELAEAAERVAGALCARGVGRGARVVWWGDPTVDAVALYFATAHLGAAMVPLNPAFSAGEAAPLLDLADPELVVGDEAHPGHADLPELVAAPRGEPVDGSVDEHDPHMIFFTSGTTGTPKGVLLSHRTEVVRSMLGGMSTWPRGATICMFPQFHMAGWAAPLEAWISSEHVVYVDGGRADLLLDAVDRHRGYRLYCIPAVWRRIFDLDRSAWDLRSLGQADTGTSATTPEFLRELRDAFPWTVTTISYGSTEAGLVTRLGPDDVLRKPTTVGPPAPTVRIRLDGGELLVRSSHLTSGYFRNEEATAAAFRGGWYHTGELAAVDDEGFVSILGRTAEVIRTGGEWVAPAEVDAVLQTHPALADVAVAGVPDADWGEVVTAFVVVRPGAAVELDDLRQHCRGQLAAYKHPRRLVVLDHLPRTKSTRQIQRAALVTLATAPEPG